jgi:hypothetical protein
MAIFVLLWITQRVIHRRTAGLDKTLNSLGLAYQELRRLEEAITCFRQDIMIRRQTGDRAVG